MYRRASTATSGAKGVKEGMCSSAELADSVLRDGIQVLNVLD